MQDDTEVLWNLDWHTEINLHHERLTGTGERGLPLGTRGAAIYARDKVVLLGCLPLNPPSFVRYHEFGKLLEPVSKRGALACSTCDTWRSPWLQCIAPRHTL